MAQLWTRRQTLWLITGAAGSLTLHACQPSQPTGNTASKAASIGVFLWVGATPLYIAQEKGFFTKQGLNLDVKVFGANTDGNTAFISGRLNAVSPVTSEAITIAAGGKDFKIVLVQDNSFGGDGILARKSIKSIADFKGKKIAVEEASVSHFFLLQVLAKEGLGVKDFTLVNAGPDAAAAAYQSGQIDIAVTYAPYLAKANTAQPDGRIIFDSAQMPTAISDLYVFDPKFTDDNPEAVQAFVTGVLEGVEFFKTNRPEGLTIAASRLGVTVEELDRDIQGVRLPDLATNLEMLANPQSDLYLLKSMQSMAEFLKSSNQIPAIPDLSKLIEPKFLQALQKS